MSNAKLVLTDSGGIRQETTILGVPCVTIRENTERPITVTHGTNVIAGTKKDNIVDAAHAQLKKFSNAHSVSFRITGEILCCSEISNIFEKECVTVRSFPEVRRGAVFKGCKFQSNLEWVENV